MKIAIYLCGHMRTYKKNVKFLKEYIVDYFGRTNVHIFIHTFDTIDCYSKTWHKDDPDEGSLAMVDKEDIVKEYAPVDIEIETQLIEDPDKMWGNSDICYEGIKYSCYSIKRCNEMRKKYELEKGMNFDVIIKLRPDVMVKSSPLISEMTKSAKENTFYYTNQSTVYKHTVCDVVSFGTPYHYDRLSDFFYENYDYIYTEFMKKEDIDRRHKREPEFLFYLFITGHLKGVRSRWNNYEKTKRGNVYKGWRIERLPKKKK